MRASLTYRQHARQLVPLMLWMGLIALLSSDLGSTDNMLAMMPAFLRDWLAAGFTGEGPLPEGLWGIRKLAHLTAYAVLGIFAHRWRAAVSADCRPRLYALLICLTYASLDEFHQSFVPTRTASPFDVLLDLAGAAIGIAWSHRAIARTASSRHSAVTRP